MKDMVKRLEVQVLRRAGHTQEETAKLVGVSPSTVRRVEGEPEVATLDTGAERERRRIGRPSKAEPFREFLTVELIRDPHVMALELLRRVRGRGYSGGKSALYTLVKELRPERPRPVVRFEGLAGEFSQHDFGHVDVRFIDGTKVRKHFFASRLKYSRMVAVTLVPNEQVEALVRAMVEHFAAWGGIPLVAVFDRPKTIAIKWTEDGEVTEWNSVFAGVVLDLGLGVELCWPHSPEQKGSVENLVGWVKGSFFKQRRFVDEEDLAQQLAAWHVEVNTQRPCRATHIIPAARFAEEKPRLRPLRVAPADLALRIPVVVGPTGYVLHDTHPYSMDPDSIGIAGTLFLYRDRVRIVVGRFEASHKRRFGPDAQVPTLPEHRSKRVAAVSGKRAKRYAQREHLINLGPPALAYLTELVHRRPYVWVRDVERLHELLERHGDAALLTAFERGLSEGVFGHEYVSHHLHQRPGHAPGAQQELPL